MIKIRPSTKIFLGFVAVVGIGWFGYNKLQDYQIMGEVFTPIPPGRINIVGINPKGYRIITANQVATLVETQGSFGEGENPNSEMEDDSGGGSVKKKISVRDMLGVLRGDSKALSDFVMSINDLNENDLPPVRVIWSKDRLQKALGGDPVTQTQLEKDLNVRLDGTPMSELNFRSLENGIVVQTPVTVTVNLNGNQTPVVGNILTAFKPRLVKAVEADVAQKSNIDNAMIAGYYKQEAEAVLGKKGSKQNIRQELETQISDSTARQLVDVPERLLKTAFVVVNENLMTHASYSTYAGGNGKPLHDLTIDLTDEGRRRLWQYSRKRVGDQILLTSDGVAIAAARIIHPLSDGEVTITRMQDQTLLDDFVATLNGSKQKLAQK